MKAGLLQHPLSTAIQGFFSRPAFNPHTHDSEIRPIELDLDDGVKVNYEKFGDLLAEVKAITGKKPKD